MPLAAIRPELFQPFVSFVASLLTIVSGALALWATLSWNRRKHQEDSELAIRKDIFLSLVTTSTDLIFYLGTFYRAQCSSEQGFALLNRLAVDIAKFQASAGKEALLAAFNLQDALMSVWGKVAPLRGIMDEAQRNLEFAKAKRAALAERQYEPTEGKASEYLTRQFEFLDRVETVNQANLTGSNVESLRLVRGILDELQEPQIRFILLTRAELRLPIDEPWFREQRTRILEKAKAGLEAAGF